MELVVDNTILSSVARCKTQAAMLYVLGLTVGDYAIELMAGQAVHEVLAAWASGASNDEAIKKLDPYKEWARTHTPPDDDRLSGRNVHRITAYWLKHHPLDQWEFIVKPSEIEVPLIHPLGEVKGYQVTMVALLDLIGKKRTGARWSVDHKTTKGIGEWFLQDQEDSSQFTGQLWLAKQKGMTLAGVMINALEYPRLPGSDRKCKVHNGVPYSECSLKHANARMIPITRSVHEVEAWELAARKLTRQYIHLKETVESVEDVWEKVPMDGRFTRSCGRCEFRAWCRVGRPTGAVKTFKVKKWDPMEHVGKGRKVA